MLSQSAVAACVRRHEVDKLVPRELRSPATMFAGAELVQVVDTHAHPDEDGEISSDAFPLYMKAVRGQWVASKNKQFGRHGGDAVLHLVLEHPRMYLTNIVGAINLLKQKGNGGVTVIGICAPQDIRTVQKHKVPLSPAYHAIPAIDYLGMPAHEWYTIFFRAAQSIREAVHTGPAVVHCVAGMNRSGCSQIMFCILRAFNPAFGRDDDYPHYFGKGAAFRLDALIAYHRAANSLCRCEVLTNPTFVSMLHHACNFERRLHSAAEGQRWLQVRARGHLPKVAKAFARFVSTGKLPEAPHLSPVPSFTEPNGPVPAALSVPAFLSVGVGSPPDLNNRVPVRQTFTVEPTVLF
jgi:hypothetical protein